jgi:hypothetical protein
MFRIISKILVIFLALFIILSLSGCCFNLASALDEIGKQIESSDSITEVEIGLLSADFEMLQEGAKSYYFAKDYPVTFKFINKDNLDLQNAKFKWNIDGSIDLEGSEPSYTFSQTGRHTISLTASKGLSFSNISKDFYICDLKNPFLVIKEHNANIIIKYTIINNGPGTITKVQCRIESPFNYEPFQTVTDIKTEIKNFKVIIDKNENKIYRFNLQNIDQNKQLSVSLSSNVVINEFIIKKSDSILQNYEPDDKDLVTFTKSEKYVDSNSDAIINASKTIIGSETSPIKKAELIYNFLCNKLEYDYDRMSQKNHEIYDASEILNWNKGVCSDYSILFAALCRAAGIPAKLVYGLSLQSMVTKFNGVIDTAHEWNEIKLPGYGWVPVDSTTEQPFLSANYFCDLKTFEGSGSLYRSIKIDNVATAPLGFFYYYNDIEPDITISYEYSVSGINTNDICIPIYDKAN